MLKLYIFCLSLNVSFVFSKIGLGKVYNNSILAEREYKFLYSFNFTVEAPVGFQVTYRDFLDEKKFENKRIKRYSFQLFSEKPRVEVVMKSVSSKEVLLEETVEARDIFVKKTEDSVIVNNNSLIAEGVSIEIKNLYFVKENILTDIRIDIIKGTSPVLALRSLFAGNTSSFKSPSSYATGGFILFLLLLIIFITLDIVLACLDKNFLSTSNILDNIKLEIIKSNLYSYKEEELQKILNKTKQIDSKIERAYNLTTANPPKRYIYNVMNYIPRTKIKENVDYDYGIDSAKQSDHSSSEKESEENHHEQRKSSQQSFTTMKIPFSKEELSLKDPVDYFQRFTEAVPPNSKNIMNNNIVIDQRMKKATFVKEIKERIKISKFFEDLEVKNPSNGNLFLYLFKTRNIYISPFLTKSTIFPRWEKLYILYGYIVLQFLFIALFLSIFDGTKMKKVGKIILTHIFSIIVSNFLLYLIIPCVRQSSSSKKDLFEALVSMVQMKIYPIWKRMKKQMRRGFVVAVIILGCVFVLSFYFTFTYCASFPEYDGAYVGIIFLNILVDFLVYENIMMGFVVIFFDMKRKNPYQTNTCYKKMYTKLFKWRNFRNCI